MTCQEARDRLSDWLDGTLTPAERPEVEAHLSGCGECRREADRLHQAIALLGSVEPARAPAGFVDRVLERVEPRPWHRRLARWLLVPLPVKLPLEAAAVALVAIGAVWIYQRSPVDELARLEPRQLETRPVEPATPTLPEPARAPAAPRPVAGQKARDRDTRERAGPAPGAAATSPPPVPAPAAESPAARLDAAAKKPATPEVALGRAVEPASPTPAFEKEARLEAAGEGRKGAAVLAPAPSGVRQAALPPGVVGRLEVKDRPPAEHALATLVARLGGSLTARAPEGEAAVLEVTLPREAWAEFTREVERLGVWRSEGEPADLPEQVRLTLRLTTAPR